MMPCGGTIRSFIAGAFHGGGGVFPVLDKYRGTILADVETADAANVDLAIATAERASRTDVPPPSRRFEFLAKAARFLADRRDVFAETMIAEAGFTRADAANEVDRAVLTLSLCAEEARRLVGEVVAFGASPGQENRIGFTIRSPIGIVCAITPFNSPLNVVLHKIGPAFAAGNAVILKPSGFTPLSAVMIAELLVEAGLPAGLLAVLHDADGEAARLLLADQRIGFYTFTGSTRTGRLIQAAAGLRRTQLELGSIASTIVCRDADLGRAIPKIANAAFRKAGQVCTSVQRLYVERPRYEEVLSALVSQTQAMPAGDPRAVETRVGPMISEAAARRIEAWVEEARAAGACSRCGGFRQDAVYAPTILTEVPPGAKVLEQEVFGPVLSVIPFDHLDEAINAANASPYGLLVGLFTRDLSAALPAAARLRFGSVHINETSSARADGMPFGGVKDSGFGHEGPRYAIREYTEERLITLNP
ncbi:aldehyde dehydrogenase family protein [Rhodoligotrophos defluvii]|uniref:aldehyde dehydrogenase family protein n=1 Tax=Rhodoligotrophos defluvii TaxID=2561934 RepID=UPI0010C9E5B6|nr:aldehyde dehydrogenase family protein [Rhodoligotrophos defluvii]